MKSMTVSAKAETVQRDWFVVDAASQRARACELGGCGPGYAAANHFLLISTRGYSE